MRARRDAAREFRPHDGPSTPLVAEVMAAMRAHPSTAWVRAARVAARDAGYDAWPLVRLRLATGRRFQTCSTVQRADARPHMLVVLAEQQDLVSPVGSEAAA